MFAKALLSFFILFAHSSEESSVFRSLMDAGFSKKEATRFEKVYDPSKQDAVLKLNILAFLYDFKHQQLVNKEAVEKTKKFIESHQEAFDLVEKKYKVSKEVIASLLWVETKHGTHTGNFHVPSVYMDLLFSNSKDVQERVYKLSKQIQTKKKYSSKKIRQLIRERTKKRSEWALGELKALSKMMDRSEDGFLDLRGSFAGAFGYPQFIPSSYVKFADSADPAKVPDLFSAEDAIFSVASYLSLHGYVEGNQKKIFKSIYAYNRSKDYVQAILDLAKKVNRLSLSLAK